MHLLNLLEPLHMSKRLIFASLVIVTLLGASCSPSPVTQRSAALNPLAQPKAAVNKPGNNCTALTDEYDRDNCLGKLFEVSFDVALCDQMTVKNFKEGCYGMAAIKDQSLCEKAGNVTGCYINLARVLKNPSLCDKVGNDNSCTGEGAPSCKQHCLVVVNSLVSNPSLYHDKQRLSDIRQIQTSIELYYEENNHYPITPTPVAIGGKCLSTGGFADQCTGTVYIKIVPNNPTPRNDGACPNADYNYSSDATGAAYTIKFCLGGPVNEEGTGNKISSGSHTTSAYGDIK